MTAIELPLEQVVYCKDLYPRIKPSDDPLVVTLQFLDMLSLSGELVAGFFATQPLELTSKHYREAVLKLFGNRCFICGYAHFIDVHHVHHKARGGTDHIFNLVPLCPNHHREWHYYENTFVSMVGGVDSIHIRAAQVLSMDYQIPEFVLKNGIPPLLIRLSQIGRGA